MKRLFYNCLLIMILNNYYINDRLGIKYFVRRLH